MASIIIHLAVAKCLEPYLNIKNKKDYYLGTMAPDIAKQIGMNKNTTHFIDHEKDVPNLNLFLEKYKDFNKNDFDIGYYIHLYTDKIQYKDFYETLIYKNSIKLLDGTIINCSREEFNKLVYNDYTNLNIEIIEHYDMSLDIFYEEFNDPETIIKEIPIDKLNILVDKMGIIIENSIKIKEYLFDIYKVVEFIELTKDKLINDLKEKAVIK